MASFAPRCQREERTGPIFPGRLVRIDLACKGAPDIHDDALRIGRPRPSRRLWLTKGIRIVQIRDGQRAGGRLG